MQPTDEKDNGEIKNTDAMPTGPDEEAKSLMAERRKTQRRLITALCVVGAACIVVGLISMRLRGPEAPQGNGAGAGAGDVKAPAAAISWKTAGKGYADLYAAIEKIAQDNMANINAQMQVDALAAGDQVTQGDPLAPSPADTTSPSATEPPANGASGGTESTAPAPGGSAGQVPPEGGYAGDTGGAAASASPQAPEGPVPDQGGMDMSAQGEGNGGPTDDYSDTNVQVAGVQEADVIKTDGDYIYAINSENFVIVKANAGKPELVAKIPQVLDAGQVYFEMYVAGDKLIAVRQGYNPQTFAQIQKDMQAQGGSADAGANAAAPLAGANAAAPAVAPAPGCIVYPGLVYKVDTSVDIFDISDKANPKKIHTLSQSGSYRDSRMIGGMLYLISEYAEIDTTSVNQADPGTYVPLYAQDGKQLTAQPDDIVLRPDVQWPAYTNVSGIDTGSGAFVSQKSLFGSTDLVYANQGSLYLASSRYRDDLTRHDETYNYYKSTTSTMLARLTLADGRVDIVATAEIPGYLDGQFSLDEKDGVLRAVVTETESEWANFITPPQVYDEKTWADFPASQSKTTNALYTYDGDLKKIGGVSGLAEGEQVYSCRFIGNACYFVTFRQVDPLFSVDVSDPKAPKVLGALKIPGFSQYLHPYTATLLLGLGNDANAETGAVGNLKLSMFDITNPADVSEKDKLLIEGHVNSSVSTNHKAILVNADRKLIAFPADDSYLIYTYDPAGGFSKIAEIPVDRQDPNDWRLMEIRGLFIGDVFYVVSPNNVKTYDMKNGFAALGELKLNDNAWSVSAWDYANGLYGGIGIMPLGAIE